MVILDEATSNLDPTTERKIMHLLLNKVIDKNKTLILISHRLENLKDFDIIYVMSEGKIIEKGTYFDLIQNTNSHFNVLVKSNH